jgi:hypothetical protein
MSDAARITPITKKILQSMKTNEQVKVKVHPDYFLARDPAFVSEHGVWPDKSLQFDINLLSLVRVEDVYKDLTTYQKTITKGIGSSSPYSDFEVICKCKQLCEHPFDSEGAH